MVHKSSNATLWETKWNPAEFCEAISRVFFFSEKIKTTSWKKVQHHSCKLIIYTRIAFLLFLFCFVFVFKILLWVILFFYSFTFWKQYIMCLCTMQEASKSTKVKDQMFNSNWLWKNLRERRWNNVVLKNYFWCQCSITMYTLFCNICLMMIHVIL